MNDELKSREELLQELAFYRERSTRNLNEVRLTALFRLSQMYDKSLHEVMDFGLEEALKLTGSKIGYIYYYDEQREQFTLYSWSSSVMAQCELLEKQASYDLQKTGLWGEAVRQRKPIITNDYPAPNPFKKGYPEGHVSLIRHLNIPIFIGKKIVAVIGTGNKESDYTADDVAQLRLFMEGLWHIIEKKRIEEELRKSEEKFKTVADFTYDWEYWLSPAREILYCSPSCNRITGYSSEEFMADPDLLSRILHPQDLLLCSEHLHHSYDICSLPCDGCEREFRIVTRAGEVKWLGHICQEVFNSQGIFLGQRVSNRDITDRKHNELMVTQSSEEISRLNTNILNMIKIVSHDIRSPLITMAVTLKLLQRGSFGGMDERVAASLADLFIRTEQILGIADDCLGKAHAVDAHMKIEKLETDLTREVIETVLHELTNELDSEAIVIDNRVCRYPSGTVLLQASKIWLKVVYRNLIMNAIKYGGRGCTIAFDHEDQGVFHRLTVYNTGAQIQEERRRYLFTKFGRGEEDRSREGIGMGLFLAREIITQHGGAIWYEPADQGSLFLFTLPK